MPSTSASQQRLFQAAAHGATFKKAREIRASMTPKQIQDFTRRDYRETARKGAKR